MGHLQSKQNLVNPRGVDKSSQDFTKYYKRIKKRLKAQNFRFSDPTDEITFEKKIALCNGVNIEAVNAWTDAYVDYMILVAWTTYIGQTVMIYPPFAIHQVGRLHALYTHSFFKFCEIITEGRGVVPLTPLKMIARQNPMDYDNFKDAYNKTREFLWQKVYNSFSVHKTSREKQGAECVWEDFETTFMRSEFNLLFLQPKFVDELSETLLPRRNELLMDSLNRSEVFRVARNMRDILGIGDLMGPSQRACPPLMSEFITTLSPKEQEVAEKIHSISFKSEFVNILAWENKISIQEALRWIQEYKKYMFLILAFDGRVMRSPSEIVDQVWHLHMEFVKEYQDDICQMVVIHHFPSKGGKIETEKYGNMYDDTLKAYTTYFGHIDKKIWPATDERFSEFGIFVGYRLFLSKDVPSERFISKRHRCDNPVHSVESKVIS